MKKCDVIIPVYNAPDYVDMCVFALLNNTDLNDIGTIYLMNDNSNDITYNLLNNIQKKYSDKKIKVVHNKENLGFIKNVNKGFKLCKSDYVMLLNTDCFVAKNTVKKLMNHMIKDEKIGLICPICSNAANLTLPIFEGFSYQMMDKLLESKFTGINYDACTVVGNCLMISKKCIDEVGYLDEIYGMGYGDETDYQFKAMEKGFTAKVALDVYVFHKAEVSFNTTNKKRSERLEKNRKIFFDRWGKQYYKLLEEYNKHDPIEFINSQLTDEDKLPKLDFAFVMQKMGNGSGGVMYVANLINYLSMLGLNVGIISVFPSNYEGITIFKPLYIFNLKNIKPKYLITTLFDSVWIAKKISETTNSKIIYFAQGYEFYFLDGSRYGEVELSYKMSDYVITISNYLKDKQKELFGIDSIVVKNGIETNILCNENLRKNMKNTIIMNIRQESLKAGYILIDIVKKLTLKCNDIKIIIIDNTKETDFCINNNPTVDIEIIKGPVARNTMYEKLYESTILVDSSISEGFGLLPLEAMATGVVPVVSNAMGNKEYCNERNCVLIDDINNSDTYVDKIIELINNHSLLKKMSREAVKTSYNYNFDDIIFNYYNSLLDIINNKTSSVSYSLTDNDKNRLKKYIISDKKYNKIIKMSKKIIFKSNEPDSHGNRMHNFKLLLKEFLKANAFFVKQVLKTILNKDYRI